MAISQSLRIYHREYAKKRRMEPDFLSRKRASSAKYEAAHKESRNAKSRAYYHEHKEDRQKYSRERQADIRKNGTQEQKLKIAESHRRKSAKRYAIDPIFRIKKTLQRSILKSLGAFKKSAGTEELLGCSMGRFMEYLHAHFEEGMSFYNHGEWHIDHKRPCASFNLANEREQKMCFNWLNLQPLWAIDNLRKGAKYGISS